MPSPALALAAHRPWRLAPFACLLACGPLIQLETDTVGDTGNDGGTTAITTADSGNTVDPDSSDGGPEPTVRAVDILFIIDNSGSMGEEQAKLATAIEGLVAILDGAAPPVDYRIGVTTTDNGNPWCGTTSPEAGNLRATSCRQRPTEFVFNGATTTDVTEEACYDVCTLETLGTTDPWIDVQRTTGTTNLGDGAVLDNLRCMLPQGIDGCGFEQPLESLWKAIRRFTTDNEPSFGFHRAGALLAVIIVTDEADCSYNYDWDTVFLPDGNRVFWSDPMAPSPTSAVCWHAGVACDGDQCFSIDLDVDGNEVTDADADELAVLRPVSRYTELLTEVGAYVFAINGVGPDGNPIYQDALMDPQYQTDFGIGPGCQSPDGTAVPPVRVHEIVNTQSGAGNEASICAADYGGAFSVFGEGILARLP
jgi:hypothetical protein